MRAAFLEYTHFDVPAIDNDDEDTNYSRPVFMQLDAFCTRDKSRWGYVLTNQKIDSKYQTVEMQAACMLMWFFIIKKRRKPNHSIDFFHLISPDSTRAKTQNMCYNPEPNCRGKTHAH